MLSPRTHIMNILVKTQIKKIPVDMGFVCWTPERSGVVGGWFLRYLLLDTRGARGHYPERKGEFINYWTNVRQNK